MSGLIKPSVSSIDNLIINGNFDVWQEWTSVAAAPTSTYIADLFIYSWSSAAVNTVSRSTDVPTQAQSGVKSNYSLDAQVTTADGTIGAGDFDCIRASIVEGYKLQYMEGQNITLSFWVKSNKTGIYCVSFINTGSDRSYVAEYTINAADTWEYKTITIPMNYSGGTWDYTTGRGLRVLWVRAVGSTFQTTAGSWQTGNYLGTSNQVNGLDSTANYFRLAQVVLRVGSIALPIKVQSYGEVLQEVQRQFWMINSSASINVNVCQAMAYDSTTGYGVLPFPQEMRSAPAISNSGNFSFLAATSDNISALTISNISSLSATIGFTATTVVAGQGGIIRFTAAAGGYIKFDARL